MNLVIIGAQKSGTSWLFSMLRQQPRFCGPHVKEVHYFDRPHEGFGRVEQLRGWEFNLRRQPQARNAAYSSYLDYVLDPANAFTDDWYRNLFLKKPVNIQRKKQFKRLVYGEASPAYCVMPELQIKKFAEVLPDARPILIVRDPRERLISGVSMILGLTHGAYTWGRREQSAIVNSEFGRRGDYAYAVPMWRKYYGDRLMILPFGLIRSDPAAIMRKIEEEFGLDEIEYKNMRAKKNSHTGRVPLSEETLREIDQAVAPQYNFLRDEFGDAFLDNI